MEALYLLCWPLPLRQGPLALLMLWCQKRLGSCQVSPKMGPFFVSFLVYRNKGNYILPPLGMRSVTVYNAFRFVSRRSGLSGLALLRLWHLKGLQETRILKALETRKSTAAASNFLPQPGEAERPRLLQNLLFKWQCQPCCCSDQQSPGYHLTLATQAEASVNQTDNSHPLEFMLQLRSDSLKAPE